MKNMIAIKYKPIAIIHSPFKTPKKTPIQPAKAKGIQGTIEINKKYLNGLKHIARFSHITLVYHFHLSKGYSLKVKPSIDTKIHGVFATGSPKRPNPIGISVVKLVKVKKNILYVENIDIVDGTPLLDIKPYIPQFDTHKAKRMAI